MIFHGGQLLRIAMLRPDPQNAEMKIFAMGVLTVCATTSCCYLWSNSGYLTVHAIKASLKVLICESDQSNLDCNWRHVLSASTPNEVTDQRWILIEWLPDYRLLEVTRRQRGCFCTDESSVDFKSTSHLQDVAAFHSIVSTNGFCKFIHRESASTLRSMQTTNFQFQLNSKKADHQLNKDNTNRSNTRTKWKSQYHQTREWLHYDEDTDPIHYFEEFRWVSGAERKRLSSTKWMTGSGTN